jgi:tight adherence protein C
VTPVFAGFAGILLFASAWELLGAGTPKRVRRVGEAIARSRASLGAKGLGMLAGGLAFVAIAPAAPGRLAPLLAVGLVAAGFLAPEAYAERGARRRRAELVEALPDALDLLAVGAATGRAPVAMFREIATTTKGPLAAELGLTVAEIDTGAPLAVALVRLRERTGAPEIGSLGAALERSQRYGSPLADQLHSQAATLRREERRRVEEHAARAAPKIQLVVALVLVPSALLTIAAALVAHSDALFGAL